MATHSSGPVEVYRPRRLKGFFLLFAALFSVGFSWCLVFSPDVSRPFAIGLVCFFGIIGLVIGVSLLPESAFLRLTPEGLTIRLLWRTKTYAWQEFEEFGVIKVTSGVGGASYYTVGLRFATGSTAAADYPGRLGRDQSGWDGVLHDGYRHISAEALADHLNKLRRRYLGIPEPTPPPPPEATPKKSAADDEDED